MMKKSYLETLSECPGSLYLPLLTLNCVCVWIAHAI